MNLKVSIDRQIEAMKKWDIDANQWLLIELLFISQQEGGVALLYKYFGSKGTVKIPGESILKLVDKEILLPFNEKDELFYDSLEFNPKFQKEFFVTMNSAGMELWESFPVERSYRINPNQPLLTRKIDATFATVEDFYLYYCKSIRYSKKKHDEVMKALEIAKHNKQVDFTIVDWVRSKLWEQFQESVKLKKIVTDDI